MTRFDRLPSAVLPGGLRVAVARTPLARARGLAGLRAAALGGRGLLLPRCRCVHTFGMRFALDLLWLDAAGALVRVDRGVAPRRLRGCRSAHSVVELAAEGVGG